MIKLDIYQIFQIVKYNSWQYPVPYSAGNIIFKGIIMFYSVI